MHFGVLAEEYLGGRIRPYDSVVADAEVREVDAKSPGSPQGEPGLPTDYSALGGAAAAAKVRNRADSERCEGARAGDHGGTEARDRHVDLIHTNRGGKHD
jgi:hypothetical protein